MNGHAPNTFSKLFEIVFILQFYYLFPNKLIIMIFLESFFFGTNFTNYVRSAYFVIRRQFCRNFLKVNNKYLFIIKESLHKFLKHSMQKKFLDQIQLYNPSEIDL